MAPNSRPPLTSRIRASFDGKRRRSTEVTSPIHTNGFVTQDTDSLRTAIDEAINSDTFQKAIAANLANLIKPSIKSALDTIQPVVEAVYSHQLLLRKTNQSVEDILLRLDDKGVTISRRESLVDPLDPELDGGVPIHPVEERDIKTPTQETPDPVVGLVSSRDISEHKQLLAENHAKTTFTLAELSSSVEKSNGKIAEALQGINAVDIKLGSTNESIESLKTTTEQSHTTMAVLQAQIDQLKDDIGQIMTAVGNDLGKNVQALGQQNKAPDTSLFDAHTTKLNAISTDLAALKGRSDTVEKIDAVATELSSLKASVGVGLTLNSEGFTGLGSQISTVISNLEGYAGTLNEIKDQGPHPEILTALQKSNDSHAAHATALGEIKERSVAVPTVAVAGTEDGSPETTAALQDLKSDLATLRENIEAGLIANIENVTSVGAKLENVLSTIEGHKVSDPSADILAAVQQANESHTSHTAVLEELKSREAAPAAQLDTGDLVSRMDSISETMSAHTATLDEIKAASGVHASTLEELKSREVAPTRAAALDTSELTSQMNTISQTINAHTATLYEIKAASGSRSSALEAHGSTLEGLKTSSDAQTTVLEQSRSVTTAGEGNAALESQIIAIVATLKAHSSALEEISAANQSHTSTLTDIKAHNQTHASALEEIKTSTFTHVPKEVESTELVQAPTDVLPKIMSTILETLETHTVLLNEMKEDVSAEILSTLHDLSQSQSNQNNLLEEIREADMNDEILTLLHATGESHASHSSDLLELKGRFVDVLGSSVDLSGMESKIDGLVEILEERKGTLEEIKSSTRKANDSHASHAASLDELISRSVDSSTSAPATVDIGGLETKVDSMIAVLEEHKSALAAIKDTTSSSHELHTSHGTILDGLKSTTAEPTTIAVVDLSGLEAQLGAITATLEEHKDTLSEVKDFNASHRASLDEIKSRPVDFEPGSAVDLSDLETQLMAVTASLEEHKSMLSEMMDLHTSHGVSLDEMKSRSTDSVPGPVVDLSGLDTQLASVTASLEEQKTSFAELKELHSSHGALLEEIKTRCVDKASPQVTDLSALEAQLTTINNALEDHKAILSEVKTTGLASHELHTVHTGVLDDIKSRSIEPTAATLPIDLSGLEAQISSISASIDELKARSSEPVAGAPPVDLSGLETQFAGLTSMLEEHKITLSEIKDTSLASQDMHAAHATSLSEIKSRSIEPSSAPINLSSLETQLSSISSVLDEHKSTLSTIAVGTAASNASHLAHSAVLGEIKDASLASNESHSAHTAALSDIKDATSSWNEAHSANAFTLAEIKDAAFSSNESHASHEAALSELKDAMSQANEAHTSHTAAFTELKSIQPNEAALPAAATNVDLSLLEGHLISIINILENQTGTLTEIKDSTPEVLAQTVAAHNLLTSHTALLDAIKGTCSHEDVNANISDLKSLMSRTHTEHSNLLKDLHSTTTESHSSLSTAIGALALGGAAGAGITVLASEHSSSEDLLNIINEKVTTLSTQLEINHTTTVTSLSTLSDELKAEIDASSTELTSSISTLQSSFPPLSSLNQSLRGLEASVKQTGSFVVGLYEGVHLNDTGIGQLQEQLVAWVMRDGQPTGESTPAQVVEKGASHEGEKEKAVEFLYESNWFKKRGPSPLREAETVSPPSQSEEGVDLSEEEMPNIGKVLSVGAVLGGAAAAAAVALHESEEDEDQEIGMNQGPTAVNGEGGEMEPEVPLDESREDELVPTEGEPVVDDNATPKALENSTLSEPEAEIESEVQNEPEILAESTEIPVGLESYADLDPIGSDIPAQHEAEKESQIPTEPEISVDPEIENQSESEIEKDTPLQSEIQNELEVDREIQIDPEVQPEPEPQTEDTVLGSEIQPESETPEVAEVYAEMETHTNLEILIDSQIPNQSVVQAELENFEEQDSSQPQEPIEDNNLPEVIQHSIAVDSESPVGNTEELEHPRDHAEDSNAPENVLLVDEQPATETVAIEDSREIDDDSHPDEAMGTAHGTDHFQPIPSADVGKDETQPGESIVPERVEPQLEVKDEESPVNSETEASGEYGVIPGSTQESETVRAEPETIKAPFESLTLEQEEEDIPLDSEPPIEAISLEEPPTVDPIEWSSPSNSEAVEAAVISPDTGNGHGSADNVDDTLSSSHEPIESTEVEESLPTKEDLHGAEGREPSLEPESMPSDVVDHSTARDLDQNITEIKPQSNDMIADKNIREIQTEESSDESVLTQDAAEPSLPETSDHLEDTISGKPGPKNVKEGDSYPIHASNAIEEITPTDQEQTQHVYGVEQANTATDPESRQKGEASIYEPIHHEENENKTTAEHRREIESLSGKLEALENDSHVEDSTLLKSSIEGHEHLSTEEASIHVQEDVPSKEAPNSENMDHIDYLTPAGAESTILDPASEDIGNEVLEHESEAGHVAIEEAPVHDNEQSPHEPVDQDDESHEDNESGLDQELVDSELVGDKFHETHVKDEPIVEYIHEESTQPTTEDPSEAGGAFIGELEDQPPILDKSHFEPPSSPFIEEPGSQPPATYFEARNPQEDEEPASKFEASHSSPVLEQHPPTSPDHLSTKNVDSDAHEDEDEGIPLTIDDHIPEPHDNLTQSHSIPYSGLHADATLMDESDDNSFSDPENILSPSAVLSTSDVLSPRDVAHGSIGPQPSPILYPASLHEPVHHEAYNDDEAHYLRHIGDDDDAAFPQHEEDPFVGAEHDTMHHAHQDNEDEERRPVPEIYDEHGDTPRLSSNEIVSRHEVTGRHETTPQHASHGSVQGEDYDNKQQEEISRLEDDDEKHESTWSRNESTLLNEITQHHEQIYQDVRHSSPAFGGDDEHESDSYHYDEQGNDEPRSQSGHEISRHTPTHQNKGKRQPTNQNRTLLDNDDDDGKEGSGTHSSPAFSGSFL